MAKTKEGEPNKSQAIRDYLANNKKAKAKDVVTALGEQGITVTTPLVYQIKGKKNGKRTKTARGTANGHGAISIDMLFAAKKLADGRRRKGKIRIRCPRQAAIGAASGEK